MNSQTSNRMPTLLLAHGSPMNARGGTAHTAALRRLGVELPKPHSILVISAHWRTNGPEVLKTPSPKTIYDFGGFPKDLYEMDYPAPGAENLAERVSGLLKEDGSVTTPSWGYDHGTWTVLRHLYPAADIPVTQLGITKRATLAEHLQMAKKLEPLRSEGVLIIGSGNITHNLGDVDWEGKGDIKAWAKEFDELIEKALIHRDYKSLLYGAYENKDVWRRAHPTLEHFIPLLYALGASSDSEEVSFPYVGMELGTLSMRSVRFG